MTTGIKLVTGAVEPELASSKAMAAINREWEAKQLGDKYKSSPRNRTRNKLVLITGFGRQLEAANSSYQARDKAVTPQLY